MKRYAVMESDPNDVFVSVEFYGVRVDMPKRDAVEFANDLRREAMPQPRPVFTVSEEE